MRHAGAEAAGGAHEIAVAGHQGGAAHETRRGGPADQHGERDYAQQADVVGLDEAGGQAELVEVECCEDDQQRQQWQGNDRVGRAHQHAIGPAAEITGGEADERAERRRGQRRRDPDHQRNPPTGQQPQQHVAAELVGAERMPGRWPGQTIEQLHCIGIDAEHGADRRRGEGGRGDHGQQDQRQFHRYETRGSSQA